MGKDEQEGVYLQDVCIMRHLDEYFNGKHLHQITAWLIDKWKSERKDKLKAGTVNPKLALLKHLFSKAVEW